MQSTKFIRNKVKRQIILNGQMFEAKRYEFDRYGTKTDTVLLEYNFTGILHESIAYINSQSSEGARTVSKPQTQILTLYDPKIQILKDDTITIKNNIDNLEYVVVDIKDIKDLNVVYDISLEVVK